MIPLFKKGNRWDPGDYRPVSVTTIVCKLLEGTIGDNIQKYAALNCIIVYQHGFMKDCFCQTNLISFYDTVSASLDDNVDNVFMDFAKIFQYIPVTMG